MGFEEHCGSSPREGAPPTVNAMLIFENVRVDGFKLNINIMSRLVITFLPRNKRLLISWLQSLSAVILEPKKRKSVTVSIVFPSICHEVVRPDAMIIVF